MSTPELRWLADWYASGKKIFPKDLTITPILLKMWYVCDGWKAESEGNNRYFALSNHTQDKETMISWFDGLLEYDPYVNDNRIQFSSCDSDKLWNWMGDPPPGFEYKWPTTDYRGIQNGKQTITLPTYSYD